MNLMLSLLIVTALIALMMVLRTFTDRRAMRQTAGCGCFQKGDPKGGGSVSCQTGKGDICPKGTGDIFCQEKGGDIVDVKVVMDPAPFFEKE